MVNSDVEVCIKAEVSNETEFSRDVEVSDEAECQRPTLSFMWEPF